MKPIRWLVLLLLFCSASPTYAADQDDDAASVGTGPFPAVMEMDPSLPTHTVYHPANLDHLGANKLPIVAFGNGSCRNDGAAYRNLLTEVASHGFLVIATGPVGGAPTTARPRTQASQLLDAIDWAIGQDKRKASRYFGKLDTNEIAVMGHSCGGYQALQVSGDPRVKTSVILNAGVFMDMKPASAWTMTKDDLAKLHAPALYLDGGPDDMAYETAEDDFSRISSIPLFKGEMDVGHMATYEEPNAGRFGQVVSAWLSWQLKGDAKAKQMFAGPNCGLCADPEWKVTRKNIP